MVNKMLSTFKSRGKVVGEMLAQANLRGIAASSAVSQNSPISFSHDPAAPFSGIAFGNPIGYRHRTTDKHGRINEVWYHDRELENPTSVRLMIIHRNNSIGIKIVSLAGKLQLSVEHSNDTMLFAGNSFLADVHGEFSGCVQSNGRDGVSEYLLEYSDIEVNTFSETLTVDDVSGAILSVDSAEADQDDGPGGSHGTGRFKASQDKYDISFDDEQVGP
jgi:hypothetical protein